MTPTEFFLIMSAIYLVPSTSDRMRGLCGFAFFVAALVSLARKWLGG